MGETEILLMKRPSGDGSGETLDMLEILDNFHGSVWLLWLSCCTRRSWLRLYTRRLLLEWSTSCYSRLL